MPPKKQNKQSANQQNQGNTVEAGGPKTSKRVGSQPDPWPETLKKNFFDEFLRQRLSSQLVSSSSSSEDASSSSSSASTTSGQVSSSISDLVKKFASTDMPEERTQALAKIGEILHQNVVVLVTNEQEETNNKNMSELLLQLLNLVLLPILFESRVRYLHKATMNIIRSKYGCSNNNNNNNNSIIISNPILKNIKVSEEIRKFATTVFFPGVLLNNNKNTNNNEQRWLRFANDLDSVSILIMPVFTDAFNDEKLLAQMIECLVGISDNLITPRIMVSKNNNNNNTTATSTGGNVFTDSQLAEIRFACRVVTTLLHKSSKLLKKEMMSARNQQQQQNASSSFSSSSAKLVQDVCTLTAINAQMLSTPGGIFPKDLLNSAGLLVATILECVSANDDPLSLVDSTMQSILKEEEQINNTTSTSSSHQQRSDSVRNLIINSSNNNNNNNSDTATILSGISLNGSFALMKGIISHFSGLKLKGLAEAATTSNASSSSSSSSFISQCFRFSSRWAERVDEPEARFLALQTLESITRYYQETVLKNNSSSNNNNNECIIKNNQEEISHILEQISDTLLSVWDDPTMNVAGPLFETFDRIIQCKTLLSSSSSSSSSSSPSFLSETLVKLLSSDNDSKDNNYERRGKWQVVSCLIPRMNFDEIVKVVSKAASSSSSSSKSSTKDNNNNNNTSFDQVAVESIGDFLIPILCRCSVSNKCNSLCGDVVVALAEKIVEKYKNASSASSSSSNSSMYLKEIIFAPIVRECLREYDLKEVPVLTEAVAMTCSNNNNGGGGLVSLLPTNSSFSAKFFINSVVTHLVTPIFKSGKVDRNTAIVRVVEAVLATRDLNDKNKLIAAQWILVYLGWRAKGCDLPMFPTLLSSSHQQLHDTTKQIFTQALHSHESDVRIAAVDVLILPHKSITNTPISKDQFALAASFFEQNWATGETTFRNTLITMLRKFLSRIVETAKHSHWKEDINTAVTATVTTVNNNDNNTNNDDDDASSSSTNKKKSNNNSSMIMTPMEAVNEWKNYIKTCLTFLVCDMMKRLANTLDISQYSVDRAMTNIIGLQEIQDCILQFIGGTNNNSSNSKKNTSVLSDFNNIVIIKYKLLSDLEKDVVADLLARPSINSNENSIIDSNKVMENLFTLLNNGWTALRNTTLNFIIRCLNSSSSSTSSSSSSALLMKLIPVRLETIQTFLSSQKEFILTNLELITSASTIRSSTFGVALFNLLVETLVASSSSSSSSSASFSVERISLGGHHLDLSKQDSSSSSSTSIQEQCSEFVLEVAERVLAISENNNTSQKRKHQHLGNNPIHGILSAIGTIVSLTLSSNNNNNNNNHQQLLHRGLTLLVRGLKIAAGFVGSHSNDVASSSSSNKIDCRGHIINEDDDVAQSSTTTAKGSIISAKESRKIVNNAWLAVNLGTHAIEQLLDCSHLYNNSSTTATKKGTDDNSNNNNNTIDHTDASAITDTLLRILLESKHNGVISKTRGCLRHLMYGLNRIPSSSAVSSSNDNNNNNNNARLRQIPAETLSLLLESEEGVCSKESQRMLRRSQGLPHAIAPILEAEDHNVAPVLLPRTMKFLTNTAMAAATKTFDTASVKAMEEIAAKDALVIHGVNALNVLKFIFEDSQLGALARPWVEDAFLVALRGFESPDWFLRNSSLMLFTAVSKRAMGDQAALISRAVGSVRVSNCTTTLSDLFLRLPKALPAMIESLAPATTSADDSSSSSSNNSSSSSSVHKPSTFPILFVLSMLKPESSTIENWTESQLKSIDILQKAVTSCLFSNSLPARVTAASALISVSSHTSVSSGQFILEAANQVFSSSTMTSSSSSFWDSLHGLAVLVTRAVDVLLLSSDSSSSSSIGTNPIVKSIIQVTKSILEVTKKSQNSIPSGVWNVLLRTFTTLRSNPATLSAMMMINNSLDSNLESDIQKCFEFVMKEKILNNNNNKENEFCRSSADDLFENCHLENDTFLNQQQQHQQQESILKQVTASFKSDNTNLGSPISRLCRAAIQNSLDVTNSSSVSKNSNSNNMKTASSSSSSSISTLASGFLLHLLTTNYQKLPLWQRIHASDAMLSSIGYFTLYPERVSKNKSNNNNDDDSDSGNAANNLSKLLLSDESLLAPKRLPPAVFCAVVLLRATLLSRTTTTSQADVNSFAITLWTMAQPHQPLELRIASARSVYVVLSSSVSDSTRLIRHNERIQATGLLLAFDDDVAVRSLVNGPCVEENFIDQLKKSAKTVFSKGMKGEILSVLVKSDNNNDDENEGENIDNNNDDDDDDDDDSEEDLFAKDEDNAFAEVGILRAMLF